MAVAYRSHNNVGFTTTSGGARTITITKPTGLTAGDYMVAMIMVVDGIGTAEAVSGWTLLGGTTSQSNKQIIVYGKTATAGDVAATNFTFLVISGNGDSNDYIAGTLIACSGTAPISQAVFLGAGEDIDNSSATQVYTGPITPTVADSVLIMGSLASGVVTNVSGYAIATDDPTWTERHDTSVNDSNDYTLGIATAPRTAVTSTGDFQVTYGTGTPPSIGVLLAVIETQSVTASPAVVTMTATVQAPTVTAGANISTTVITMTVSVQAPTVTTAAPDWANIDKSSTVTLANTDKSSASWVNPDKSSAPTWINTDKS